MLLNTLMLSPFAANDTEGVQTDDKLTMADTVLDYLNITDDTVEDDEAVSRAEFAMLAAKLMGYTDSEESHYAYYADVPVRNIYCGFISYLSDRGAVSIPDDRMFNPDDSITLEQAYKILFSLAGYGPYIEKFNGGFPHGYIFMAKKLKLDIEPIDKDALNYGEVKKLLYGFGNLAIMAYGIDNNLTNKITTFASVYSLYMGEGIVNETYIYSTGNQVSEKNEIVIDTTRYKAGNVNVHDFFLDRVEFAYTYNEMTDVRTLIAMRAPSGCNDELVVKWNDVISFNDSDNTLNYYNRDKSARVTVAGATVIYNGRIVGGKVSKYINGFVDKTHKGTVKLKKYTGDYEYIIIEAYQSGVVSQFDSENSIIYDRNHDYLMLDLTEYENVYVENAEGQAISVSRLSKGDVFSVLASADKKILRLVQGSQSTDRSGQVRSVNKDKCEIVLTDGSVVDIDKAYMDSYGDTIVLNGTYDFYADIFGEIVDIKKPAGADNEFKIGYMIDAAYVTKGMDGYGEMKLLDSDGTINIYRLAEKPLVDNVKFKHVIAAMNAIPGTTGIVDLSDYNNPKNKPVIESQLIRYKLRALPGSTPAENEEAANGENSAEAENAGQAKLDVKYEIYEIDTDRCTDLEVRANTLNCFKEYGRYVNEFVYDQAYTRFSMDVLIDPNKTIVINVPLLEDGYCVSAGDTAWDRRREILVDIYGNKVTPTDELYYVGMDMLKQKACYIQAYNYDPDSLWADVVVLYRSAEQTNNDPFMVAEKFLTIGKYGFTVQAVRGLAKTGEQWRYFPENYDLSEINVGDIVRANVNKADGNASTIQKVFDAETLSYVGSSSTHISYYNDSTSSTPAGIDETGYYQSWQMTKGYVINHDDKWIRVSYDLPENDVDFDEVVQIIGKTPIIYDSSRRKNKVYFGNVNEIADYRTAGTACSFAVSYSRSQQLYDNVFIFK